MWFEGLFDFYIIMCKYVPYELYNIVVFTLTFFHVHIRFFVSPSLLCTRLCFSTYPSLSLLSLSLFHILYMRENVMILFLSLV